MNGAAVVPRDTVVQLLHSGAVCYTMVCFYVAYMLYVHMEPCENRLIVP